MQKAPARTALLECSDRTMSRERYERARLALARAILIQEHPPGVL